MDGVNLAVKTLHKLSKQLLKGVPCLVFCASFIAMMMNSLGHFFWHSLLDFYDI